MAGQFGWLVEFDGTGKRVNAVRVASSLSGMHVSPDGSLFAWSAERLHIVNEGRVQTRIPVGENPLGWYAHPGRPGLLCTTGQRLMLRDVNQ